MRVAAMKIWLQLITYLTIGQHDFNVPPQFFGKKIKQTEYIAVVIVK